MNYSSAIHELGRNKRVFNELLTALSKEEYLWKPHQDKWCLLEIVCHLHDEEREDFRERTRHILENRSLPFTSIDPTGWVKTRNYMQQNFTEVLGKFLTEREQSVKWLESLVEPKWDNVYDHPKLGLMTAKMFLVNWVAHDYLHVRQILKLKYDYLKELSNEKLNYAGTW